MKSPFQLRSSQLPKSPNVTRTVIVDPAIRDTVGHHLTVAAALSAAAHSLGHKPIWLGHKLLADTLVPSYVTFIPAFSSTIYQNQIGLFGRAVRPLTGDLQILRKKLRERAWEVELRHKFPSALLMGDRQRELFRALHDLNLTADDLIILPSADPQTVDILASWCETQLRSAVPQIHIRTCWSESNMPFSNYGGGFANAVRRVASVSRLTLSAETEGAAELWSQKTGFRFDIWHCIADVGTLPRVQDQPPTKPFIVAWLGEPRAEKGTAILPEVIERVLDQAERDGVKFLLQDAGRASRKALQLNSQLAKFEDALERIPVGSSPSSYLEALERSHILLLPYEPKHYPMSRCSGVAVEGLLTAKPMVVTRGTFAETLINGGNGIAGSDAEELASGILKIISDFEKFYTGALRAREKAIPKYDVLSTYQRMVS